VLTKFFYKTGIKRTFSNGVSSQARYPSNKSTVMLLNLLARKAAPFESTVRDFVKLMMPRASESEKVDLIALENRAITHNEVFDLLARKRFKQLVEFTGYLSGSVCPFPENAQSSAESLAAQGLIGCD